MRLLSSPVPQRKARIEIIPLIDVMFFLLTAFMLVSLSMQKMQTKKMELATAVSSVDTDKSYQSTCSGSNAEV